MQLLGSLPDRNTSVAYAVNWNGTVVTGEAIDSTNYNERKAFIWTPEAGMQFLLPSGTDGAIAMNLDGSVIVGESKNSSNNNLTAFLYQKNSETVFLPSDSIHSTSARSTNWDGSIVLGNETSIINYDDQAFIWSPNFGKKLLYMFDEPMEFEQTVLSQDGQVIVTKTQKNSYILHNFATKRTLNINKLIELYLVFYPKYSFNSYTDLNMSFLGNVIIGNGNDCLTEIDSGWRIIVPRYDILDCEGIDYEEPEYIADAHFEMK